MMISMRIMTLRNMTVGQTMMTAVVPVAMVVGIIMIAAHHVDVEVVQEEVVVAAEAEEEDVVDVAARIPHADQKTI